MLLTLLVAAPAGAQDEKPVSVALGYAIVRYLDAPVGYSPFGVYAAATATRQPLGFEVEGAYHHDARSFAGAKAGLNTLTAAVGPRYVVEYGDAKLYLHALAGLRHDRLGGVSSTAYGGMVGGGAEFPFGSDVNFRLGGDAQIFRDEVVG